MVVRRVERPSMRRGRQTLIGLSLLAAAIVAGAVIVRGGTVPPHISPGPAIVASFDTVTVPVPVEPVPQGVRVRSIRFKKVAYPRHQLPEGALLDVTSVLEGVTTAPLPAHLPLFRDNVTLTQPGNPVTERIPPGMRAMTLKVDATSAVEGWAGSGTVVDILLIERDRSTVVAERVKILSAERSVSPVEGSGAPLIPNTVTLLVSQEQCLAINTAIPRGRIAFALRSGRDEETWSDPVYTAERLSSGAILADTRGSISGYATVRGEDGETAFALANGRWVRAETVPNGFMVARASEHDSREVR